MTIHTREKITIKKCQLTKTKVVSEKLFNHLLVVHNMRLNHKLLEMATLPAKIKAAMI